MENKIIKRLKKRVPIIFVIVIMVVLFVSCNRSKEQIHVLVFSKTEGFRHSEAIKFGKEVFLDLGEKHNIIIDTTEDASAFNEENLKQYRAIVFLNVSGEVLNAEQRNNFQRFIQAGGGFMGVHGSTDAERNWPWYGRLIGAYFKSHPANPNVQEGTYIVQDKNHPATNSLPDTWERKDEFYDFKEVNPDINVLIEIDESTYQGGITGKNHPSVWYHEFDGGRSFYTAMGHTPESYKEPLFIETLWGGLEYILGGDNMQPLDYNLTKTPKKPDNNRFVKFNLLEDLNEPMALDFDQEGRIFFVERRGNVHVYEPEKKEAKTIGVIPVYDNFEDGLLGIALDPDHHENRWLYLFYTNTEGKNFHVSRFALNQEGLLNLNSEKILLSIPKEILDGSHTGGDLVFDPQGTGDLYITVGDNSSPRAVRYAPIDERPGRIEFDAQRTSANTNDLRGKILRIHPEPDGTYSIPNGNLFKQGTPKTQPEIYSMGHRQPWRLSISSKNGWLYLGEVGPDAKKDSIGFGPAGYDEFNIIKKPGNFGWPYFIADNQPYWNVDFENDAPGDQKFDPNKPLNTSPNNTGRIELPATQKSFLWYPYAESKKFPHFGSGGRSATGGPIFHKKDFENIRNVFPDYYDGKWFITDWVRGWILVVTMDAHGNFEMLEPFLDNQNFSSPIDMDFGPDGSLYILDYGNGWFSGNIDAKLVKIEFNAGNRPPVAKLSLNKKGGTVPLNVSLTSVGSYDLDKDNLTYNYTIMDESGEIIHKSNNKNTTATIDDLGVYKAILTVKDSNGEEGKDQLNIIAGNSPPELSIKINGNRNFFTVDQTIDYEVKLIDKEDGSLQNGRIKPSEVSFSIVYLPVDIDVDKVLEGDNNSQNLNNFMERAEVMINEGDCRSCHSINKESAGPTYLKIAERYRNDVDAIPYLSKKIIEGGKGAWGELTMPAHPEVSAVDSEEIAKYILSLTNENETPYSQPLKGKLTFKVPEGDKGKGIYLFEATYTDKGAGGLPSITTRETIKLYNREATNDMMNNGN